MRRESNRWKIRGEAAAQRRHGGGDSHTPAGRSQRRPRGRARSLAALALLAGGTALVLLLAQPQGAAKLLEAQRVIGQFRVWVSLVHKRQLRWGEAGGRWRGGRELPAACLWCKVQGARCKVQGGVLRPQRRAGPRSKNAICVWPAALCPSRSSCLSIPPSLLPTGPSSSPAPAASHPQVEPLLLVVVGHTKGDERHDDAKLGHRVVALLGSWWARVAEGTVRGTGERGTSGTASASAPVCDAAAALRVRPAPPAPPAPSWP